MYIYFILCSLIYLLNALTHQAFGPYKLTFLGAEGCKGPKRKNCTDVDFIVNDSKVEFHINVKEDTTPTKGKIVGTTNGKEGLTLQVKSLCNNIYMRSLINKVFNVTKDCVVLKGEYKFTIDVQEMALKYQGGSFIYDDWTFKSVFFNDDCNFNCLITKFKMSPK